MRYLLSVFLMLALLAGSAQAEVIVCGDFNGSGVNDIGDVVYMATWLFQDGPPPVYPPAGDCDGDGDIDIADVVCWVNWMFGGGQVPPACPFVNVQDHLENSSGCLVDPAPGRGSAPAMAQGAGYMYLEVFGSDLHVHHMEAYYQCCLMYRVDWYQSGNVLTGFESDTGALCDCYCDFNLYSIVQDLDEGTYTVVLIGIENDTVGVGEATVGGSYPSVLGYGDTGCLPESLSTGSRDADIDYTLVGDTLTMVHHNGWFNCGGIIATGFAMVGDTLRFYEFNVSEDWAYCMCYFEVWAIVIGIQPGTYVAEVYARDWTEDPIELIDQRVITLP